MSKRLLLILAAAGAVGTLPACSLLAVHQERPQISAWTSAPYPKSRLITRVDWNFSAVAHTRRALGSDLWPCTWARDGNQYCAWGDGGGFDGNDDQVGRASLGFARLTGLPRRDGSRGYAGKNVWGSPPYAEAQATFGGKVLSMVSAGGNLYAVGAFWTAATSVDPVHQSGAGPQYGMAWSADLGKSWALSPWSAPALLGHFLNAGQDNAAAPEHFVYLYYLREGDQRHLYLKRVAADQLLGEPNAPGRYSYFAGPHAAADSVSWSTDAADARPIFADANQVDYPEVIYDPRLHRYLMTLGHYRSGDYRDASAGQFGIFESPTPWGPWATVAYYDNWENYATTPAGDFLGMHMPPTWHSASGKIRWFVYSGPGDLDAFNLIKATFHLDRAAR